jgi:hypothetical protein
MPLSAATALQQGTEPASMVAQLWRWLTQSGEAYAAGKGHVRVVGTNIEAFPIGGGRFELIGVPDGPVTLAVTTPDGVTGTFTLTLPTSGGGADGGALVDLGILTVRRNGLVLYQPPVSSDDLPLAVQVRGTVSGLASVVSGVPADGSCPTFVVAGLTFCFDQHTQFSPPLSSSNALANGQTVEVRGSPSSDPSSRIFQALDVQTLASSPSGQAPLAGIRVIAPITGFDVGTLTVFGGSMTAPDVHALTFTIGQAAFHPPSLAGHLANGLLVTVTGTPVSTDPASGQLSATASVVNLVPVPNRRQYHRHVVRLQGTVSSLQSQSGIFGLNRDSVFVKVANQTLYEAPLTGFASLAAGQSVRVLGFAATVAGASVWAADVEPGSITDLTVLEARGTISSLDRTRQIFVVAGITFQYGSSTRWLDNLSSQTLTNGLAVHVWGTALTGGVSTALAVKAEASQSFSSTSDKSGTDDQL